MKIVLDTNCFISCVGKKSPYRNVFDSFLHEQYVLVVTTDILLEYEEIFQIKWGESVTENLLARLMRSANLDTTSVFFKFNMVDRDADDNKFADAFISSGADILVSNDSKLLALNNSDFPRFRVITLQEFSRVLNEDK